MGTGYELQDIGGALSWSAFGSFLRNVGGDSAIAREMDPDVAVWSGTVKTNAILADIYDVLTAINANLNAIGSGKRAKKPKPYPRPGHKDEDKDKKKYGKGALPKNELRRWIESKRKERVNNG